MSNKCKEYETCDFTLDYRQGLESPDKNYSQHILTVCLDGGNDTCIEKQKSLDEKLEEEE